MQVITDNDSNGDLHIFVLKCHWHNKINNTTKTHV